ncbi:Ribonuclease P protein subunit p14 [Aphanomyces cochlioides]|nr:Ribonuclease P protein subunit p14 [Aphanomyces cochlioides]
MYSASPCWRTASWNSLQTPTPPMTLERCHRVPTIQSPMRRTSALRRGIQVLGELTKVPQGALPAVGVTAEIHHTFSAEDVKAFAALSGDTNPLHVDPAFAATTVFGKPVVHGILCTSLFPTMFGATMPGAIYVSQNMRFHKPLYVNEPVRARIEVTQVREFRRFVICSTKCFNKEGDVAISGEAQVMLPKPAVVEE